MKEAFSNKTKYKFKLIEIAVSINALGIPILILITYIPNYVLRKIAILLFLSCVFILYMIQPTIQNNSNNFQRREFLKIPLQVSYACFSWIKFYYTLYCEFNVNKSIYRDGKIYKYIKFMGRNSRRTFLIFYMFFFSDELNFSFSIYV